LAGRQAGRQAGRRPRTTTAEKGRKSLLYRVGPEKEEEEEEEKELRGERNREER
jgi:hypothetical protein